MKESSRVRLENLERELVETRAELCQLRRRNLWLMRSGILMVGLLVLTWMFMDTGHTANAQGEFKVHKEIRANKFILVDKQGMTRAVLGMGFYDQNGNLRSRLAVFGPGLILHDEKGQERAVLSVENVNGPILRLSDQKGKALITLQGSEYSTDLVLKAAKGKALAALYAGLGTRLQLGDEKGRFRTYLIATNVASGLELFNKKGESLKSFGIISRTESP